MRYGSDVVADLLADLGVEYVAATPGATFRGLHDSLLDRAPLDRAPLDHGRPDHGRPDHRRPGLITCPHEEISVALAHGYAKAAGRPMAAAVHDVVGLQHASMAIYNAWCDSAPVLVLGGTGPVDAARRRPWIDWIHTANVQATQVRDYTKWDDQPASIEALPESLIRAHRLATATPPGPVYVCLDSAVQEAEVPDGFTAPSPSAYPPPALIAPDPEAIATVAGWLSEARLPVLAVERVGRSQQALDDLVALAELLGAPLVQPYHDYARAELCFPTDHRLNVTGLDWTAEMGEPDVVVAIEVRDVGALAFRTARAKVAHITTAQLNPKAWAADLQRLSPADLLLQADAAPTLHALLAATRAAPPPAAAARGGWLAGLTAAARRSRPAGTDLAAVLDEVTGPYERVLANGTLNDRVLRTWAIGRVDSYLGGSGGAGLGYGLGASLGAALAHRDDDRLVVDIQSDGDALMTPGALWTAAHHRLPVLIVMDDNRAYRNSVVHAERIARARGREPGREGTEIVDPVVDFAGLARALGVTAYGPVYEMDEAAGVLAEAAKVVLERRIPVLVDVVTQGGDPS